MTLSVRLSVVWLNKPNIVCMPVHDLGRFSKCTYSHSELYMSADTDFFCGIFLFRFLSWFCDVDCFFLHFVSLHFILFTLFRLSSSLSFAFFVHPGTISYSSSAAAAQLKRIWILNLKTSNERINAIKFNFQIAESFWIIKNVLGISKMASH